MKIVIDGKAVEIPGGGSGGVTMEEVNAAIDAELGAYTPQEVYSTEEVRIGTWIDGKPIYRKVYVLNSGPNGDHSIDVPGFDVSQIDTMVRMNAIIKGTQSSGTWVQDGWYLTTNNFLSFQIFEGYMKIAHAPAFYANRPLWVILEYTKTTDEATVAVSVPTAEESANVAMDMSAVPAVPMPVTSAAFGPDEED